MKNGNDVKDGNVNEQVKIICSVFLYAVWADRWSK